MENERPSGQGSMKPFILWYILAQETALFIVIDRFVDKEH